MHCKEINNLLDEYLDGTLDAGVFLEMNEHIISCSRCQAELESIEELRLTLRHLPNPQPRAGFFDEAMAHAREANHRQNRFGWQRAVGAALAASMMVWLAASVFFAVPSQKPELPGVTLALNEVKTVQLTLNSQQALTDAKLTITLPEGVELQGYPGLRQLSWRTSLDQGVNLLPLPLVATALRDGRVMARLEHNNKARELSVQLRVVGSDKTGALLLAPDIG